MMFLLILSALTRNLPLFNGVQAIIQQIPYGLQLHKQMDSLITMALLILCAHGEAIHTLAAAILQSMPLTKLIHILTVTTSLPKLKLTRF